MDGPSGLHLAERALARGHVAVHGLGQAQQLVVELRAHCQAAAKGQIQLTKYIIAAEKHQGHTARLEAFAQVLQPCVQPAHL